MEKKEQKKQGKGGKKKWILKKIYCENVCEFIYFLIWRIFNFKMTENNNLNA